MLNKKFSFGKKVIFLLLLLISSIFVIDMLTALFFFNKLKIANKISYEEQTKYLTSELESENIRKQQLFLKTIADYAIQILKEPISDVTNSIDDIGDFLSEFSMHSLLTQAGRASFINNYFSPVSTNSGNSVGGKGEFFGVDNIEEISSDALLLILDSLQILKDSSKTFISSVFVMTSNGLCVAYPKENISLTKLNFKKLEETYNQSKTKEYGKYSFIDADNNLILLSKIIRNKDSKKEFTIAAIVDLNRLMSKICEYAWKRNIEASILIDSEGRVLCYKSKKDIPELKNIVSEGKNLYEYGKSNIAKAKEHVRVLRQDKDGFFLFSLQDKIFYAGFSTMPDFNWKLLFIASAEEIKSILVVEEENFLEKNIQTISDIETQSFKIQRILLTCLLIFFILIILMGFSFTKRLTRSLVVLAEGVERICNGNFSYKIPLLKTGDEIEKLILAFNSMVDRIKQYIKDLAESIAERKEIEADIKVAANIQARMLPGKLKVSEEINTIKLEIESIIIPSKTISGDFYDYFLLDNENLFFTIGDISGKGVPASLFMVTIKTLLKDYILRNRELPLTQILTFLNESISRDNYSCMFATMFCGIVNLRNGLIKYAVAGHDMPLLLKAEIGRTEDIVRQKNHVLGVFKERARFQRGEFILNKDDFLLLYTDGVTEAKNRNNENYGREKLIKLIEKNYKLPISELVSLIKEEISAFTGFQVEKDDDFTLIILKRKG